MNAPEGARPRPLNPVSPCGRCRGIDGLDIRIIRSMGIRPYGARPTDPSVLKPAQLAKRLGVSVNTVKSRIARMVASAVIAGSKLMPNLRQLGLTGAAYYFASPPDAARNPGIDGMMAECLSSLFEDLTLKEFPARQHFDPPHRAEPEGFAAALLEHWNRATP